MATHDDSRWLADYRPIEVDVSSLAKLAKALREEVDGNFWPHAKQVGDTLDPGQDALPDRPGLPEWQAARSQYFDSRDHAIYLLDVYARATSGIAEAAELIVQRYQDADALAHATVSDVRDAFAQAVKKYGLDGMMHDA